MAAPVTYGQGIRFLHFNKRAVGGLNIVATLREVESIRMTTGFGLGSTITLKVINLIEKSNTVLVEVEPYNVPTGSLGYGESFIFTPYLPAPFQNSEYNALLNNAVNSRQSDTYFTVDYTTSQITASNLPLIVSKSATLAEFNDSNLSKLSYTNPRYNGSRLQGAQLNVYTQGDVSYGKEPVINYNNTYFAYFNYIGGSSPERNDTVAAHILYLVDKDGKVYEPGANNTLYGDLLNTFRSEEVAQVILEDPTAFGTDMSTLNGSKQIYRSGVRIEPIAYSQTGSDVGDFKSTIYFGSQSVDPGDFRAYAISSGSLGTINVSGSSAEVLRFTEEYYDQPTAFSTTTFQYKVPNTSSAFLKFTVGAAIKKISILQALEYKLAIQRSGSDTGGTFVDVVSRSEKFEGVGKRDTFLEINTGFVPAKSASFYRAAFTILNAGGTTVEVTSGSYFKVDQSIEPPLTVTTPYWLSGSTLYSSSGYNVTDKYLFAGTALSKALGIYEIDIAGSGFNTIKLPFDPKVGDEIRFEAREEKTHLITKIYKPEDLFTDFSVPSLPPWLFDYGKNPSQGNYILEVQPDIYSNTNIDNFVIRRYVEDGSYILLYASKPGGQTSAGLLKPQYLSEDIVNNFDVINRNFRRNLS
jgi:hypothetical protein